MSSAKITPELRSINFGMQNVMNAVTDSVAGIRHVGNPIIVRTTNGAAASIASRHGTNATEESTRSTNALDRLLNQGASALRRLVARPP